MTNRLALGGLLLVTGCLGVEGAVTPVPPTPGPGLATVAPAPATMAPATTAVVPVQTALVGATEGAGPATPVSTKAPAGAPPGGAPRSVAFTEPADGAQLASPVTVCLASTGVNIEAGDEVRPGYGHLLVMVDPTPQEIRRASAIGAPLVPPGPTYVHYAEGEGCRDLELSAGHHVLLGLLVDGSGTPINPQTTSRLRLEVIP